MQRVVGCFIDAIAQQVKGIRKECDADTSGGDWSRATLRVWGRCGDQGDKRDERLHTRPRQKRRVASCEILTTQMLTARLSIVRSNRACSDAWQKHADLDLLDTPNTRTPHRPRKRSQRSDLPNNAGDDSSTDLRDQLSNLPGRFEKIQS